MTEIKNVAIYGLKESIIRSSYPKNLEIVDHNEYELVKGDNRRAEILGNAKPGSGHDCYCKGVVVQFDLKTNQSIWMQAERYTWLNIISSQSKMHRITNMNIKDSCDEMVDDVVIDHVNSLVDDYNKEDDTTLKAEKFRKIIMNCPMGLELTAGMTTNYLQLKTIYHQRKNHKMSDWKIICDWILSLPRFNELALKEKEGDK